MLEVSHGLIRTGTPLRALSRSASATTPTTEIPSLNLAIPITYGGLMRPPGGGTITAVTEPSVVFGPMR